MKTVLRWLALIGLACIIGVLVWTRPQPLSAAALDSLEGEAEKGALVFAAAGCASCHMIKDGDPAVLSGGQAFPSDFGTFYAPNISSDPEYGIGAWSDVEVASAIMRGVGRDGSHLYPAFPYSSYMHADMQDIADLIAYLRTLPASNQANTPHQLGFPFNIRAGLGVWKALFLQDAWRLPDPLPQDVARGRYLVEALGHCAECHTPRGLLGGLDNTKWLAGAPHPSGEGRFPNITPGGLDWSAEDIAAYLSSGFTPEYDTAGGEMAEVVTNTAQLTDADRAAIAAYIKAVPAIPND